MRRSLVCFSTLSVLAASIVAGCGSDNTTAGDSGPEAGTTADSTTTDSPADVSTTDSAADSSDSGPRDSSACMPLDANVATVPVGAQWACFQAACSSELTACGADCVCNNAIIGALFCVAAGADSTTCFTSAVLQSGSIKVATVVQCLGKAGEAGTCAVTVTDGGAEASKDGGAEGSTDSGSEGGAEGGGTDGAVTDAPLGG